MTRLPWRSFPWRFRYHLWDDGLPAFDQRLVSTDVDPNVDCPYHRNLSCCSEISSIYDAVFTTHINIIIPVLLSRCQHINSCQKLVSSDVDRNAHCLCHRECNYIQRYWLCIVLLSFNLEISWYRYCSWRCEHVRPWFSAYIIYYKSKCWSILPARH